MRLLLVSTYELGHQPLHLTQPQAALGAAGHEVRVIDLSVEDWDWARLAGVEGVAFSVPMHTALRLAHPLAEEIRTRRPDLPVAFYGLYAGQAPEWAARLVGEYQSGLLGWAGSPRVLTSTDLGRHRFVVPARVGIPGLESYSMLTDGRSSRLAGYVEGSHGCRHRCRHCPIPAVYDGRYRIVGRDTVLEDISNQVESGAEHITLGDPDFLNAPRYSLDLLTAAHHRFPDLTFDITVKVSHILDHRALWPKIAACGVIFVVSAFETTNDGVLSILAKGHDAAGMSEAVGLIRSAGIEIRPSWLPYTPWTEPDDLVSIFRFLADHELLATVDPVQLSIRLLVPRGSLLANEPEMGAFDPETLSHTWVSPHPEVEAQQRLMARLAEEGSGSDPLKTIESMWSAIMDEPFPRVSETRTWRLSEPWFCCAEPTQSQLLSLSPQRT